jgi:hypothetical protein
VASLIGLLRKEAAARLKKTLKIDVVSVHRRTTAMAGC